jgi:hypothetical protein
MLSCVLILFLYKCFYIDFRCGKSSREQTNASYLPWQAGNRKIFKPAIGSGGHMGLFGKLFGKKDDGLGLSELDKSLNMPTGLPSSGMPPGAGGAENNFGMGLPQQQNMGSYPNPAPFESNSNPNSFQDQQSFAISKEIEVISIKLDAIKVAIESISQRLASLERATYNSQEQGQGYNYPPQRRYYQESPPRTY